MLILSIFYIPIASADVSITIENWDTYSEGASSGSNAWVEWERVSGTTFLTSNLFPHSSPNSLIIDTGTVTTCAGYINLTTSFEYIGIVSFFFHLTTIRTKGDVYIEFFNDTHQVLKFLIMGHEDAHNTDIVFYDVSDTPTIMADNLLDDEEHDYEIRVTHNESNYMDYQLFKDGNPIAMFNATDSSRYAGEWSSFDSIYIYTTVLGTGVPANVVYLDDIDIILVTGGEGGETELEGFNSIGYTDSRFLHETNAIILETQCAIVFNAYIKAIDLQIGNLYIDNFGVTINNLYLKLNGIPKGHATALINSTSGYTVRWLFDTVQHIDNEMILCEFYTDSYTWYIGYSKTDIDNDGDTSYYNHNQIDFYDGFYSKIGNVNYDLCYKIWGLFEAITPSLPDTVYLSKSTVDIYEPVDVYVTVSTKEYQNYLNIYNSTYTLLESYAVNGWSYHLTYNPESAETHYFNLTRNNIVKASESLTVNAKDYNYLIFTSPNPSRRSTPFDIKYIYNNTQYDGILFIYNDEMSLIDSFFIPKNTGNLTTISYSLTTDDIYIMRLAVYINLTEYETKYTHTHVVQSTIYENVLRASGETINVGDEMTLFGSHNFLFGDVYIKISDDALIYVGDSNTFSFKYVPQIPKIYVCALILKISGNVELILDYANFTALGEGDIIPEEDIFGLPIEYMNAMFGAFITLGFLIIPFALSMKHKGDTSSVIYAIFGGVGLGIATLAGLFPIWLPFMICVLVIGILIIEYKKK